jgi:hypothetical protein
VTSGRVYLPVTAASLRRARDMREFGPAPLQGHAVTPAVLAELPDASEEELEYAALTAAALDSLTLLTDDDRARRMVAAVDVTGWEVTSGDDADATAVVVPAEVPWRRLASVLVDAPDAEADVAAARLTRRQGADEAAAAAALSRCLDHDLGWYAVQELDQLLASW